MKHLFEFMFGLGIGVVIGSLIHMSIAIANSFNI